MTNVGTCPTFNGEEKRVETNIFDFDKTVYGSEVMICFYKWLREEKTFASAEELKAQLDKDKQLATTLAEDIKYMDYSFKMC
jgi:riboflavin kinase/FMN adenylyltransferase